MDRCPNCDERTFDTDSQACYTCGYGMADDPAKRASSAILHSMVQEVYMSEHEQEQTPAPAEPAPKIYPGNIDRYKTLRGQRETLGASLDFDDPAQAQVFVGLVIAEELAGLSYILDGIRYNSRQK